MPAMILFVTLLGIGAFIWGGVKFALLYQRVKQLEEKVDAIAAGDVDRLISLSP